MPVHTEKEQAKKGIKRGAGGRITKAPARRRVTPAKRTPKR